MSRDAAGQTDLETRSGIAGELDRAQENGARIMPRHPDIGRTETIAGQAQALSQLLSGASASLRVIEDELNIGQGNGGPIYVFGWYALHSVMAINDKNIGGFLKIGRAWGRERVCQYV